jgi:fluoride exporter
MILAIAVGCAGALGAVGRYVMDGAIQDRTRGVLPLGTMTVNVVGSLMIGLVAGVVLFHGLGSTAQLIVGTGFCGGLTTWSTTSWETFRLLEDGEVVGGILNALGGLAASLAAAGVGLALVGLL